MFITKENNGKVELKSLGFYLSFDPINFWKQSLSNAAQQSIDEMVTREFERIIPLVTNFYTKEYKKYNDYDKSQVDEREVEIGAISILANFMRNILPLSSDSDVIYEDIYNKCNKDEQNSIDFAVSIYRYCPLYGYKSVQENRIEI